MAQTAKKEANLGRNGSANLVYQMTVTLRGIRPAIWRSIRVTGDTRLWALHGILQTAMGWKDEHPHRFLIDGTYYSDPRLSDSILKVVDEDCARLCQVVSSESTKFLYQYGSDWGWDHEIRIEKILPRGDGDPYSLCLDGNGACPPEDCVSPYAYRAFLKTLKDKSGTEGNNGQQWIEEDFDPERFNVASINRILVGS